MVPHTHMQVSTFMGAVPHTNNYKVFYVYTVPHTWKYMASLYGAARSCMHVHAINKHTRQHRARACVCTRLQPIRGSTFTYVQVLGLCAAPHILYVHLCTSVQPLHRATFLHVSCGFCRVNDALCGGGGGRVGGTCWGRGKGWQWARYVEEEWLFFALPSAPFVAYCL